MVAYDPTLEGRRLVLRDSMVKFDCPSTETASLEVIKYSEESKCLPIWKFIFEVCPEVP